MVAGEGRGTTGECEVEGEIRMGKCTPTPSFCYGGINSELPILNIVYLLNSEL